MNVQHISVRDILSVLENAMNSVTNVHNNKCQSLYKGRKILCKNVYLAHEPSDLAGFEFFMAKLTLALLWSSAICSKCLLVQAKYFILK